MCAYVLVNAMMCLYVVNAGDCLHNDTGIVGALTKVVCQGC